MHVSQKRSTPGPYDPATVESKWTPRGGLNSNIIVNYSNES